MIELVIELYIKAWFNKFEINEDMLLVCRSYLATVT